MIMTSPQRKWKYKEKYGERLGKKMQLKDVKIAFQKLIVNSCCKHFQNSRKEKAQSKK